MFPDVSDTAIQKDIFSLRIFPRIHYHLPGKRDVLMVLNTCGDRKLEIKHVPMAVFFYLPLEVKFLPSGEFRFGPEGKFFKNLPSGADWTEQFWSPDIEYFVHYA